MNASAVFAMMNRTVQGIESGVKSHSVDGLTLHLEFLDGTTSDIVFEQPEDGKDGESAYDVAVRNGFEGDEQEWMKSLQGKQGENGVVVTCKFPYWETENESSGNTVYISMGQGYLFTQVTPETTWVITHNFGNQYPSVVCVDDDNNQIFGTIHFQSEDVLTVSFSTPTKGKAFIR